MTGGQLEMYRDVEAITDDYKSYIDTDLKTLHPEDRIKFCRDVATRLNDRAVEQEEINDRDGVPERPRDIEGSN
jgi:hypothetical protein